MFGSILPYISKENFILFMKGMAMGIANIIPGVSGGTIALVTNIYEKLINTLKKFDTHAIKLLFSFKIKKLTEYIDLNFLIWVFGGSLIGVFSIAKLFEHLFEHHPLLIWSFFFGLILASVYFIGKRIKKWGYLNYIITALGVIIAISLLFLEPAQENDNLFFILFCGIIGVSGMMLPGLSGSFILILLGNYELILVSSITELNYIILILFCVGSIIGLFGFSHIIAWLLEKYKDQTLSILTGFISGSLFIIWPWKTILKDTINTDKKNEILHYTWELPNQLNTETVSAIGLIICGIIVVYFLEKIGDKK